MIFSVFREFDEPAKSEITKDIFAFIIFTAVKTLHGEVATSCFHSISDSVILVYILIQTYCLWRLVTRLMGICLGDNQAGSFIQY